MEFLIKHGFRKINPVFPKLFLWLYKYKKCRAFDLTVSPGVKLNLAKNKTLTTGLLQRGKDQNLVITGTNEFWVK